MSAAAPEHTGPLRPGATLGILGGGQLGRMIAMAAARLGFATAVYDPDPDCPAGALAGSVYAGRFDDNDALRRFAGACDVVTYEFENVPVSTLDAISPVTPVYPGRKALETSQDRLAEKDFIAGLGIGTAAYADIADADGLEATLGRFGKAILKTRRFGYDGKGQARLSRAHGVTGDARQVLSQPCILEEQVDFTMEISVIAARGRDGAIVAYDPAWNQHREGILRTSRAPAPIAPPTARQALGYARTILEALEYVGVIGIEFFISRDGGLLVNEFAPRVHNSGHWTEAGCAVSQFENHVRAVCGLPLGDTTRHSDCEMTNLIGDDVDQMPDWLARKGCHLHLYGKRETRPGRKMGHVTRIFPISGQRDEQN